MRLTRWGDDALGTDIHTPDMSVHSVWQQQQSHEGMQMQVKQLATQNETSQSRTMWKAAAAYFLAPASKAVRRAKSIASMTSLTFGAPVPTEDCWKYSSTPVNITTMSLVGAASPLSAA